MGNIGRAPWGLRSVSSPFGRKHSAVAAVVESIIAGYLSAAQARLVDNSLYYSVTNGPVWSESQWRVDTPGVAGTITWNMPAGKPTLTGNTWIFAELVKDDEETGLAWRFRGLVPTYDPVATTRNRSGQQVFKLPVNTGSTRFGAVFGTGLAGTLKNVQAVQMETILAQPFDLYVCMGQSQMACTTNALGIIPEVDYCFDPTLLYFPGSTYAGHGTVMGQVDALKAPLQANSESIGGGAVTPAMRSNGVSPAIAFAKAMRAATAAGRNVVIIQAAVSSTGLVGAGGAWNPSGTTPFAYNHAVDIIAGAMAASPAGSKIKGVLWCQGESDLSSLAGYPAAWEAMRSAFEATWSANSWVDAPVNWIIGTTPPDAAHAQTSAFIAMQNKLDSLSGDATSKPRCHVVNRQPGVEADGVHATAVSNRVLGAAMATRLLNAPAEPSVYRSMLGSGSPASNTLNDTSTGVWYGQIGGLNPIINGAGAKNLIEANVQRRWRAGVLKESATVLCQQTRLASSVWKTRINGADGQIAVLNPGGAIAALSQVIYNDATNIDAIADGDLVNNSISFNADAGMMVNPHIGYTFDTPTQTDTYLSAQNVVSFPYNTSAIRYIGFTGFSSLISTTLAVPAPIAGTFSRLQMQITVAGSATKVYSTNINGAAGQCALLMSTVALVEDATNIDAFALGDLIQSQALGAGTTSNHVGVGVRIKGTTKNESPVVSHGSGTAAGNGTQANFWSGWNYLRKNNVESETRNAITHAGVASNSAVNVTANTNEDALTFSCRRAAADLNQIVAIPALTTGVFTDATNVDAFTAGQAINHSSPAAQTSGTLFLSFSYKFSVAA